MKSEQEPKKSLDEDTVRGAIHKTLQETDYRDEFLHGLSIAFGQGEGKTIIYTFPSSSIARLITPVFNIELSNVIAITDHEGDLKIESQGETHKATLQISTSGDIVFTRKQLPVGEKNNDTDIFIAPPQQ